VEPGTRAWHPSDYLVRGGFCPLHEIWATLDRMRKDVGASVIIHLAFDRDAIIWPLCFATGTGSGVTELDLALPVSPGMRPPADLARVLSAQASKPVSPQLEALAQPDTAEIMLALAEFYGAYKPASPGVPQLLHDSVWSAIKIAQPDLNIRRSREGELISIILVDRLIPRSFHGGLQEIIDDLTVKIRATPQSVNHRDAIIAAAVAEKLPNALLHAPGRLPEVLGAAIDLAVSVTGSDGGAVYLMQSGKEVVYRLAASQAADGRSFIPRVSRSSDNALARSIENHRTYQISSLVPTAHAGVIDGDRVELITPIAGPLASSSAPAIGALALFRADPARGFNSYDQELIRNVTLRIALLHATVLANDLATATAQLNERDTGRIVRSKRPSMTSLPGHYRDVLGRIQDPLAHLCETTYSQMTSLRLALPDSRTSLPHGLALVRCAAHPRVAMNDRFKVLRESDGGIIWSVMLSGETEYVPDVSADPRYLAARPDIASQLCIPIKTHGITIGTLNLESPIIDNYTPRLPAALAFAGALGRAFEEAAIDRARIVIDQAALSIAKRHAIDNHVAALKRALQREDLSSRGQRALDTFSRRTQETLAEMRGRAIIQASAPGPLLSVLASCVDRLDTSLALPADAHPDVFHREVEPLEATAINIALTNILSNAIGHVDPGGRGPETAARRTIEFHQTYLDGRDSAVITVRNRMRQPLSHDRIAGLYRYPLTGKNDELRLGAFLAGLAAQRIGGRLHAYQTDDMPTLTSVLIIPVKKV